MKISNKKKLKAKHALIRNSRSREVELTKTIKEDQDVQEVGLFNQSQSVERSKRDVGLWFCVDVNLRTAIEHNFSQFPS